MKHVVLLQKQSTYIFFCRRFRAAIAVELGSVNEYTCSTRLDRTNRGRDSPREDEGDVIQTKSIQESQTL